MDVAASAVWGLRVCLCILHGSAVAAALCSTVWAHCRCHHHHHHHLKRAACAAWMPAVNWLGPQADGTHVCALVPVLVWHTNWGSACVCLSWWWSKLQVDSW
jgi:hypothetical protein